MQRLLHEPVGVRVLLKGLKTMEEVFEKECSDALMSELREQLRKKASQVK